MGNVHPVTSTGFIIMIAIAACGPATARDAPAPPANDADKHAPPTPPTTNADPLGLSAGKTWTFRGTWTRWDDDTGKDVTTPLTWTTTILSADEKGGEVTYRIQGWPGDAPAADRQGETTTLIVPAGGAGPVSFGESPGDWVSLPLTDGAQICEDAYCWRVEAEGKGWDVVLRTGPDVTLYHLEPGRGVTRFEYHHNGTTDDVVLERVD